MLTYNQTSLQLFMWSYGARKNIYNIYKLVFCPGKIKIAILNYDHGYLQLLMLNHGKGKIIYDNQKLVFHHNKLHNYNIIPDKFYNYRSNYE